MCKRRREQEESRQKAAKKASKRRRKGLSLVMTILKLMEGICISSVSAFVRPTSWLRHPEARNTLTISAISQRCFKNGHLTQCQMSAAQYRNFRHPEITRTRAEGPIMTRSKPYMAYIQASFVILVSSWSASDGWQKSSPRDKLIHVHYLEYSPKIWLLNKHATIVTSQFKTTTAFSSKVR